MKRRIFFSFCIFLLSILTLCVFNGCNTSAEELAPPENVVVEKRVLSWDAVENATGYTVRIGGEEYPASENRFSVHSQTADGGKFSIDVMANGDGKKYDDSPWTRIDITLDAVPTTEYDEAGFYYSLLEDKSGYEISRGNVNLKGVITIPGNIGDYPVKRISEYAFCSDNNQINCFTEDYCNTVTTGIILPQGLESIGNRAFAFMVRLKEIVIPDSVVTIDNQAFNGCTHMTKAVLPKNLKVIPAGCFMNTALDEIILPETLETIWAGAFYCQTFDPNEMGYPIGHINSKMSSVVIPDSVKKISNQAFRGRENLATIVFPDGLELLDGRAFHETAWYEAQPEGFITIKDFLYEYKGELPENYDLTIPAGVKKIAGQAFKSQKNLRSVVIPEGVRLAGENIFSGCENLSEVVLPQGLKLIPATSFNGTKSLKSITIPDTVTEMGRAAFASSGLESVTIPSSIKEIPQNAFNGCKSLTSVYISDGVEIIRGDAFGSCEELSDIHLPSTLKGIEARNFSRSNVEKIIIPKSVETIYSIFSRCENLACVFYEGDATLWDEVTRELNFSLQNPPFSSATIYFYAEEKPEEEGNFWHYVDGVPAIW